MIDTNVRKVKRSEDGRFTALNRSQQGASNLCDHCSANDDCKVAKAVNKLRRVKTLIMDCKDYQIPIAFRDTTGTEGKFNTIRLGPAWASRVAEGDIVGLVDKDGNLFGRAKVTSVHCVWKPSGLYSHGRKNHLMLGKEFGDSDDWLKEINAILRNSYGKMVFENNSEISVIYLERCD